MKGRVLAVGGSNSGGGAGIQADIKTITALGAYATTAITAITAQNTLAVTGIWPVPAEAVRAQMAAVLDDIGADVVKTGMLCNADIVAMLADLLAARPVRLVVDPVMAASAGRRELLSADAIDLLRRRLPPLAELLTPNAPEAAILTGQPVTDAPSMRDAALALLRMGARAVLLKGGHLEGDMVTDLLATPDRIETFSAPRLPGRNTHGAGCTLASAIAAGLAQGMVLREAVARARAYLRAAMAAAPGLGQGEGPMNHGVAGFCA